MSTGSGSAEVLTEPASGRENTQGTIQANQDKKQPQRESRHQRTARTVQVRLAEEADLETLYNLFASDRLTSVGIRQLSKADMQDFLTSGFLFDVATGCGFLIGDNPNGEPVAAAKIRCSLKNLYAEIVGASFPDPIGAGYGRPGLYAAIRFLFDTYPLERIETNIIAGNRQSIALHKRMGFVHEGTKRRAWFAQGHLQDQLVFGMLRSDFEKIDQRSFSRS